MSDKHKLPDELSEFIGALSRFAGDMGAAAEVDWQAQTVAVIGQVGSSPDQYEAGDIEIVSETIDEIVLETIDGNFEGLLDEHYEGEIIERQTTDSGFRYVFDVSMYNLPQEPKKTRIPFEDVEIS